MQHRFQVGQVVRLVHTRLRNVPAQSLYDVVRLLPVSGAACQYRIRGRAEGYDRLVQENEIMPAEAATA